MTAQPDPNPVSLSLPWPVQSATNSAGGDLILTPGGSLVFCSGIEKIRQRIIRRFFTCPEERLADGEYIGPDYIFDSSYGIGATRLIGEPIDNNLAIALTNKINAAVLVDESVDVTQRPLIILFTAPGGIVWARVTVYLLNSPSIDLNWPVYNPPGAPILDF